jgi:hypothetical protein
MAASGSGLSQIPVRLMCLLRINKLFRCRRFAMQSSPSLWQAAAEQHRHGR